MPSPDGRYLLVETLHRPFSYLVPAGRFPRRFEVWDLDGKVVRTVADLPLAEEIPITFDSVAAGPRAVSWRADAPATLFWVEALDGGDAGKEAAERDRAFQLAGAVHRRSGAVRHPRLPLPGGGMGKRRPGPAQRRVVEDAADEDLDDSAGSAAGTKVGPKLLFDRSIEDRYGDPGQPLTTRDARGQAVLRTADGGKTLFFVGAGASAEGDRPFLDALDLDQPQDAPPVPFRGALVRGAGRPARPGRPAAPGPPRDGGPAAELLRARSGLGIRRRRSVPAPAHPLPAPDAAARRHPQGADPLQPSGRRAAHRHPLSRRRDGSRRTGRCPPSSGPIRRSSRAPTRRGRSPTPPTASRAPAPARRWSG